MWILLILLSAVTLKGSQLKQQYFRVKPQDREAIEGETIEFQCHVENVAGDVQWSKDGFLLGFESNVPGYPRYFMIVNTVQGVYNLRIESVRLEDEAEFQCQVGPSDNQKPIRAQARLTVVIPPKSITINGLPDGEEVMVRESQRLVLTCKTRGSKPPVEMKWYRRAVELVPEASKISITLEEGKGFTTESSLTLYPKLEHSGTTYTCEAFHPTLENPLRVTISVGVLFPPSPPIIQGYQEDDFVQLGDTVVLVCLSRGGKPAPRIVWYRNDALVDTSHSSTGYETTNTFTFVAKPDDNKAVFRCEVTNAITKNPMKKSIRIRVLFGPRNLTITGPTEARLGDTIFFNCQSEYSNPPAQLSWIVDNNLMRATETEKYTSPDGWITSSNLSLTITRQDVTMKIVSCYASAIPLRAPISNTHKVIIKYPPEQPTILGYEKSTILKQGDLLRLTCVALGGNPPATLQWLREDKEIIVPVSVSGSGVSSELAFRINSSDNGVTYRCLATNSALSEPLETAVTLTVYFPPENILLSIDPRVPREGQQVKATCEASSNPAPKIIWLRKNKLLNEYYEQTINDVDGRIYVKSDLIFIARSSDDATPIMCRATTDEFPEGVAEEEFLVRVRYKPKFLNLVQNINIMEGESTEINMTAIGNPEVLWYKWYKKNSAIPSKSSGGIYGYRQKHRLTSLGPMLYITIASRHDTSSYTCEAHNEEGTSNATIFLNVHYPAIVTNVSSSLEVKEGENVNLECHFDGNPLSEDSISWKKDELTEMQHMIQGKRSYLTIVNVTRTHAGDYACVADNGVGKASVQITTLSVIHRPAIRRSHLKWKVASDLKDTAKFRCVCDSYSNTSIKWKYNDVQLEKSPKYEMEENGRNSTWESTLLVKHLEESDFGIYKCLAINHLGRDIFEILLVKRGPPEPPVELQVLNVSKNYILISWKSGFDGGYVPSFRVRYRQSGSDKYHFQDASAGINKHRIVGLKAGVKYLIAVSAWNDLGHSNFTSEIKVVTNDAIFMDTTEAAPEKKSKKEQPASKWWWITAAVVGTLLVLLNVIVVICLIHKGKCCARSIEGLSCSPQPSIQDSDKQVRYRVGEKTFYITGEKIDTSTENIMMEKLKLKGQKMYLTVDMLEGKLGIEATNTNDTSSYKNSDICEETSLNANGNEYPDILKQNNSEKSAFNEDQSPELVDQLPFTASKGHTICSSTKSLNVEDSVDESTEQCNISLPITCSSNFDLRIRHILFEPEQPSAKPFVEESES